MSNFCRITGKTRGLPAKSHFFPLLPAISPAEAKKYRTNSCRITSNFNPNHNYIPIKAYLDSAHVLKCQITRNSLFKYKHFQFIAPVVTSKTNKRFFYVLDSKVLIVPDEIEMQMSKGIITDVQISNHTIGFKYNYKVKEYDLDVLSEVLEDNLIFGKSKLDGEVAPGAGLKCVKKRRIGGKRRGSIAQLTSVFEEKEKRAELDYMKASEKISPDQGKVKVVQGKLEEVKRKVSTASVTPPTSLAVPEVHHEAMEIDGVDEEHDVVTFSSVTVTDQVVPDTVRYLCRDGSLVECVGEEVGGKIVAKVVGNRIEHGMVVNGEFTPGEVVKVVGEDGVEVERLIPGQWVDNHFQVGQFVEVCGVKRFYPGQVMEVNSEKRFVPGQLVLEDDTQQFKFVPAKIDTNTGEFHPSELIETSEGLKFICDKVVGTHEFELQTFELENPVVDFTMEDVKAVIANVVPVEFDACCEVIFQQAVFEKRVDERIIHNAKEFLREGERRVMENLVEAISFAELLGNESVAMELKMLLDGDEELRKTVLSDPGVKFLLCQLVVIRGIVGGGGGEVCNGGGELEKVIYKSKKIAEVLMDDGHPRGRHGVESSGSGGSLPGDLRERGSSVGSGGSGGDEGKKGESDEISIAVGASAATEAAAQNQSDMSMHRQVTTTSSRQTYMSSSVETHEGAVIQFQSMHSVSTELTGGDGGEVVKRQRLVEGESLDLDSIPRESVQLLDTTPAKHKLSLARQLRKRSEERGVGQGEKRSKIVLKSGEELMADSSLIDKNERDLILYELVETEEEFVRDLEFVMGTYYKEIESSVKFGKYRDVLFEDFKAIYSFHRNSLLDAIRYYQDDPVMIAKSFLRLERDFEPHVRYYQDHLKIQELISNDLDLLEFIEDLSVSKQISDSKSLSDHLKLPLQRINDYVLIFKDLLDVCSKIHDDSAEREVLSRVLEFLVAIPQKLDDRKFLNSIEGIDASVLSKLGRLIGHDWFVVTDSQEPPKNRYVFLFKQKILVTKVKRISEHRSVFLLKQALHLPDYTVEQLTEKSFKLEGNGKEVVFDASTNSEGKSTSVDNWVQEVGKYTRREGQEGERPESRSRSACGEREEERRIVVKKGKVEGLGVELNVPFEDESFSGESSEGTLVVGEGRVEGGNLQRSDGKVEVRESRVVGEEKPGLQVEGAGKREKKQLSAETGTDSRLGRESKGKPELVPPSSSKSDSVEKPEVASEKSLEPEASLRKPEVVPEKSLEPEASLRKPEVASEKSLEPESNAKKPEVALAKSLEPEGKDKPEVAPLNSSKSVGHAKKPEVAPEKRLEPEGKDKQDARNQVKPPSSEQEAKKPKISEPETKQSDKKPPEQKPKKSDQAKQPDQSKKESIKKPEAAPKEEPDRPPSSADEVAPLRKEKAPDQQSGGAPTGLSRQDSRRRSTEMDSKDETPPPDPGKMLRRRSSVIMARQTSVTDLKIVEPMQSTECEPGGNATFKLRVSSNQTIITWLKGNRPLDDKLADRVKIESKGNVHSLTILNVREQDESLYTAKVCELIGKDGGISEPVSCSAVLVVHELTPEERAKKIAEENQPNFLVKFKDTELLRHTTVNFLFLVRGTPEPTIVFKRNDKEITPSTERISITPHGSGKYELRIEKIEDTDAGTYTVVATNKHGITEVNAVVRVVDEKDVFNEGTAMKADQGVGGDGRKLLQEGEEPIFTWFKDGKMIDPGEDFKVLFKDDEDTLALVFQHVKPEDAGLYTCVASTTSGRISCSAELTVQGGINQLLKEPAAPTITANLTDTEVGLGGSAMMELKVTGFPKPHIAWYKGNELLEAGGRFRFLFEDDESIALIIKNVCYDDEATYKVVATNDLGEATTSGKLIVRQPPRFMKKMDDMSMMAGEAFTIDVEVEGNPRPELKWYKDGVLIVSSERIKFTSSADGLRYSMCIERVTLDDTGAYSVVASNAVGQMSEFWNVLATMPARFTERLPGNVVCEKGDKGGEYVLKTAGVPDPKVEVKFDGKELKVEKVEERVYKIVVPELKEAKDYEVIATATNQFAKDESVCVFNVKRGVKIVEGLKDIIVQEHGEAVVGVKVDCFPKPKSVKWFIDGVEIGGTAYEQKVDDGGRYTLKVKDAYKPDSCKMGVRVLIDNGLGEGESSATITMQAPPVIKNGLAPLYRLENNTTQELAVTLRETTPVPTGTWYHNGKEVSADARIKISKKSTETYTLTFDCVKYEDAGEWAFKAVNDIGEVWTRTTVIVEGKPQITSPLPGSMRILETETYDLEVNVLDYCEENVKIEWKADVETVFKPIVTSARDGDQYHSKVTFVPNRKERYFKVVATNKYGETESICQIDWIELVPPKIMTPLKDNYTIQDGDPFKFASEVEGVPKPRVVWLKNGEMIAENVGSVEGITDKNSVGEYSLHATNVAGEAVSTTKLLLLQTEPTLSSLSEDYSFKENEEDLVLSVDISGSPIPTVTWLHDGSPVDLSDPRVSVCTTPTKSTLIVKNAAKSDKGAYSVQVSNDNGAVEGRASVDITFPPEITGKLTHPDLVIRNTRFEVKGNVIGEPFPEISWIHPTGKPILCSEPGVHEMKVHPDGSCVLAIESAQMTDGGVYKLVAKNERGEAMLSSGIVNVEAPRTRPRINPPLPPQIKLVEGQPLVLRTTVKAHPIPELALKFEDADLEYEQRTIENGLEFEHKTPKVTTSGTYTLRAKNTEGTTESECKLVVIPRLREGALSPPAFTQDVLDKVVNEGNELVLIAKVDGNPIPDVSVLKNGKELEIGDALEFDGNTLKFRVPEASMGDAGEYAIVLKNSEGESASKCNVKVNKVYKAPEFRSKFTDQAQLPTRDCKFGAKVSGFPSPTVRWLKDGKEIDLSKADKYRTKNEDEVVSLQVRNCDDGDIGVYTCELSNVEGTASCNAKLDVVDDLPPQLPRTEMPYFLKTIGSTEVYPGMQAKFTACIAGNPEPEFEWFRDGNRIHETPGSRIQFVRDGIGAGLIKLIVNDTNIGDLGEYKLRIWNDLGEATCSASLKFDSFDPRGKREQSPLGDYYRGYSDLRPTALPDRPVITRMDDKSCTINWKPAVPNVHSKFPCTYILEMAPADGNEWKNVYTGLRNCYADFDFPSQTLDYKFRVRVQWGDKYISEPSPYVITNRGKLNLPPLHWSPIVIPSIPRSYDLTRPPHPQYTHAPRFLNPEREVQYAPRNSPATVYFAVYGYPKPTISFRFNGQPANFSHTYTDNGLITLFLNEMNDTKVGTYECIATNPHGVATQGVELRLTEVPYFLEHLKETHVCARKNGKLHCVVSGIPCPQIRLFKDWHPSGKSFQVVNLDEFTVSVTVLFEDALLRDEGLYSIVATNHAGSTHSSSMMRVYEDENAYNWSSYGVRPRVLRLRKSDPNDYYHFGSIIGRGTQGVHYHVVETRTGGAWAAKRMVLNEGNALHRHMIESEIENWACVNSPHVVRLYDGFFDNKTFVLINELCNGGDLFGYLIYELEDFDEGVARGYLEQVLRGIRDLHEQKLWVCGLQPLDILLTHKRSPNVKITDFGVSRYGNPEPHRYSHPEYASPELISSSPICGKTDLWSFGVIAHILLTGHHPYVGLNDRETMENLKNWNGKLNESHVANLSPGSRSFLESLLRINPGDRPSACEALEHEWFSAALPKNNIFNEGHVKYYNHLRAWQSNADCVELFRRNPLETAYKHPSKMVYPPGYDWVEEREFKVVTKSDFEFPRPYVEIDDFVSESHYTSGEDTYLLQLRDTDFPARLRQYMKVAASQSPSFALHLQGSYYDRNVPIIRERRKFTDIMDEEVDDERRARIVEYGEGPINSEPRRLRHEVGARLDIQAEAEAIMMMKREGREPVFRERPLSTVYVREFGGDLVLEAVVDGDPVCPDVQWFKNDTLLQSNDPVHKHRLEVNSTMESTLVRSSLEIHNLKDTDLTCYKVTARNKQGQVTWKFRVAMLPDNMLMPKKLPSPNYAVEKSPAPISTEMHAYENVSTPEVVLKGAFGNVVRSGDFVYKVCSEEELGLLKGVVNNHVLGGEYDTAIQVGLGVALRYGGGGGLVPLLDHIVGLGSYTEQTVVRIMEQVLHGLSYLHWSGVGVIGLGPGGIAVDSGGVVKIVDLSGGQRISRCGVASELVLGKLNGRLNLERDIEFVAPECLSTTDTQVTGQADIWSVGVLMYLLLSGHSPFRGNDLDETKQNILFVRFRFEHLYKDLTQEATRLIMLIFKRSPLKRPSAEECFEHRWFHPTESLTRKRQRFCFGVEKIQDYLTSLIQDEETSSTSPEYSNNLLNDFYRAHNLV